VVFNILKMKAKGAENSRPTQLWKALLLERRIPTRYLTNNFILKLFYGIRLPNFNKIEEAWMINENFNQHIYCPKGFEINSADTVIDIGANIGIFSIYAGKKAKEVFSYEPVKDNFRRLSGNIKSNNLDNIFIFNKGVSSKNKRTRIYLSSNCPQMHSQFIQNTGKSKYEEVDCISLKNIINSNKIKRCSLLKIDCEGAEYDILFKAPKEILNRIDKISMEYHILDKRRNDQSLIKFFKDNGFIISGTKRFSETTGIIYTKRSCINQ